MTAGILDLGAFDSFAIVIVKRERCRISSSCTARMSENGRLGAKDEVLLIARHGCFAIPGSDLLLFDASFLLWCR